MTDGNEPPKAQIKHEWIKNQVDGFSETHQKLVDLQENINDGIDKQECISILEKFANGKKIFSRNNPHEHVAVAVVGVQAALHHLGYSSVGNIDGFLGDNTKAAVENFQEQWNTDHADDKIDVDGIPGPQTIGRLLKELKAKEKEAQTAAPESRIDWENVSIADVTIEPGQEGILEITGVSPDKLKQYGWSAGPFRSIWFKNGAAHYTVRDDVEPPNEHTIVEENKVTLLLSASDENSKHEVSFNVTIKKPQIWPSRDALHISVNNDYVFVDQSVNKDGADENSFELSNTGSNSNETAETEQKIASAVDAARSITDKKELESLLDAPFFISDFLKNLEFKSKGVMSTVIFGISRHIDWHALDTKGKGQVVSQLNEWWKAEKDLARTLAEEDAEYL